MATILVCEPHADVRSLLAFVVRRLGHEPVLADCEHVNPLEVDAVVLEPGDPVALAAARRLRKLAPAVPVVCISIFPPSAEALALEPDAYLVKPFPLPDLERALERALQRVDQSARASGSA